MFAPKKDQKLGLYAEYGNFNILCRTEDYMVTCMDIGINFSLEPRHVRLISSVEVICS